MTERIGAARRDAVHVTVVGAGYVGATSAVVLARLGHRVTCIERDAGRLQRWRRGEDPLQEPGLIDLLRKVEVGCVPRTSAVASPAATLSAGATPMGASGMPDLTQVEAAAAEIGSLAKDGAVVLMRSTVPVGTCDRLQSGPLRRQLVVSNPEFLREGHALEDALFPDRIVAGGPLEARAVFDTLYRRVIDGRIRPRGDARTVPVLWMSARSAELAKYAANGFLATKLSFVNEIANLARAIGADGSAVLESMGFDPRIGPQHLRPGLGWGGSCFPKDTRALQAIADGVGYDFVVLKAAIEQNTRQLCGFAAAITGALAPASSVALLGLAFKAGTPDTRESPAIALARLLLGSGLRVRAYDPAVRALPDDPEILVHSSIAAACDGADAIVVATEWPEFAEMDLTAVRRVTRGALLFDGRDVISQLAATAAGFRYQGISGARGPALARTARLPRETLALRPRIAALPSRARARRADLVAPRPAPAFSQRVGGAHDGAA
jgi:UDPglucose 6-dehydrogenase